MFVQKKASKNNFLMRGLGIGIGEIINYLSNGFKDEIFKQTEESAPFDLGLGQGIGHNFRYLKEQQLRSRILDMAHDNINFGFGLGYGIGRYFAELTKTLQKDILKDSLHPRNGQIAKGLSQGLTENLAYLSGSLKKEEVLEYIAQIQNKKIFANIAIDDYGISDAKSLSSSGINIKNVFPSINPTSTPNKNSINHLSFTEYDRWEEQMGVQSSLLDEDLKQYLDELLREIKRRKKPETR